MRRTIVALTIAALPLSLTACGDAVETVQEGVSEATEAAGEAAQLVRFCTAALEVADAVNARDWERAIERGEEMVAEAPDEIRPDAQTVLEGARSIHDGDTAVAQSEEFQRAVERVRGYTRDRCDPTS